MWRCGTFKNINFKLLVAVLFSMLLPSIYKLVKIYFVGEIPSDAAFTIASQIAWLNIIYEVLQEAILLPLFYILGAVHKNKALLKKRVFSGIKWIFPIYFLLSLLIWFFTREIATYLKPAPHLLEKIILYIRLETFTIPFRLLFDVCFCTLVVLNLNKKMYLVSCVQIVLRCIFDFVFVKRIHLGIQGLAYSSWLVSLFSAVFACFIVWKYLKTIKATQEELSEYKRKWLKLSLLSGMESAIRNVVFVVMILKLVNEIQKSDIFWVANNFIWGWLLLPMLSLGQVIKQDVGNHQGRIGKRFSSYVLLNIVLILFWLLSLPFWELFIGNIMNFPYPKEVSNFVLYMLGFYVIFSFNHLLDSYFYGMGRNDLMLYQTIGSIYYLVFYILYERGIFISSLQNIALLFGWGLVLDFLITAFLFYKAGYFTSKNV